MKPGISRTARPSRAALAASFAAILITGCSGNQNKKDSLGQPVALIAQVYTRPGTNIQIDIMTSNAYDGQPNPYYDFTPAELALVVHALDSLTAQQLMQSGINEIEPGAASTASVTRSGQKIIVLFSQSSFSNGRPLDPNLGNEILTAMGFPPAAPTGSSQPALRSNLSAANAAPDAASSPVSLIAGGNVISQNVPTSYVPILSAPGAKAVEKEFTMVNQPKDSNQSPTLQDQTRPHGPSQVINPSDSSH